MRVFNLVSRSQQLTCVWRKTETGLRCSWNRDTHKDTIGASQTKQAAENAALDGDLCRLAA